MGRKGGIRSGEVRRGLTSLNPAVLAVALAKMNNSPLAGYAALRYAREREAEQERLARLANEEPRRTEEMVCGLLDEADRERAIVARLREQVAEFERREQELRRRLDSEDGLEAWLQEIGEERLERALSKLGWIEEEPDAPAAA